MRSHGDSFSTSTISFTGGDRNRSPRRTGPGMTEADASFMSGATARQTSRDPDSIGRGHIHDAVATDFANSDVAGAKLILLLFQE